jgi:hypothetical protein
MRAASGIEETFTAWAVLRHNATRYPSFESLTENGDDVWTQAEEVTYPFGNKATMSSSPYVQANVTGAVIVFPPVSVDSIYATWSPRAGCYDLKGDFGEANEAGNLPPPPSDVRLGSYCDPQKAATQGHVYYKITDSGVEQVVLSNFGDATGTYNEATCRPAAPPR